MKNLKLYSQLGINLDLQSNGETLLLSSFDVDRNRIFFASSANFIYALQLPLSQASSTETSLLDLEAGDRISAMEYLMEKEALLLGTLDGCLLLHSVDTKMTELVGKIEGGVKNIVCSPDGALLAVTTGFGQLLVMTYDWDLQYESPIEPEHSENMAESNANGFSLDEYNSSITWRGDGKYFATLCEAHGSSLRKIRIWERDSGTLHSASEAKSFMGTTLDWMPSGAKVAAVYDRKSENKSPLLVFFEKNGLERSTFAFDGPLEATIDILKWNCNSDLLAASVNSGQYDAIVVWSFSNNHWYLKQEMQYLKEDGVKFIWDPVRPLHLVSWTLGGKVFSNHFVWNSAVTETSVALVIDNCNLLVTPLALSLMPPPMSLFNLKFQNSVQEVSYFSTGSKNCIAACLSNGSLCAIDLPVTVMWDQLEDKCFDVDVCQTDFKLRNFMHLTWLDSHSLLGVSCFPMSSTVEPNVQKPINYSYVHEIQLISSEGCLTDLPSSSGWHAEIFNVLSMEKPIVGIVRNPAKESSAFIQMNDGSIVEYSRTNSHFLESNSEHGFLCPCPLMKAVLASNNGISRPLLLGLEENGTLHCRKRVLCNNCSSFSFYSTTCGVSDQVVTHLLLTTKQDYLLIVNVEDLFHGDAEIKPDSYNTKNQRVERKDSVQIWEKGAKVIGAIHGDEAAVILQTNRGNLECIYPRKLVLVAIVNALVQRHFRDAMHLVRRHRIDFNVVVDYCGWKAFLGWAKEFVCQVNNLGHITEFVSSLKTENIIDTLYKDYMSLPAIESTTGNSDNYQGSCTENKVSSVLQAVRKALEQHIPESPARELCILTTLARSKPPALTEALSRIKVIRELELVKADDVRYKLLPSSEESLKHLLWLTDAEAVYEAALGLYDLNLAAIVALNSQKDPKEFLPFLKGLEQLPLPVMKYKIDLRLKRYESALKHIASAGDDYYEDGLSLLKNNPELFPLGLHLFTEHDKRLQILEAWGDHLNDIKCFQDAAITYFRCSLFQKALKAYRACADWRGVFTVAGFLKLEKEDVHQLANDLCEELQALGKPAEAATIALEYLMDFAKVVDYLIMAREWEEALRIAYMQDGLVLLTTVKDAALECATTLALEYNEGLEKVGKYLARYLAVRQRRLVLAAKIQSEERLMSDTEFDTQSESSTNLSEMSAYTTRTAKDSGASVSSSAGSKARLRRQKHKGGKIRAGSPGEEMALVEHLKTMALSTGAQRELKSLIVTLMMLGKEDIATKVQSAAEAFEMSHRAAVMLMEDTVGRDIIDENTHTLDYYLKKLQSLPHREACTWQCKLLMPPKQE